MNKKWILTGVIPILFGNGIVMFLPSCQGKKTDSIRETGIVEGTEVNISSEIPGTIVEICCQEGDPVQKDAVVIRLQNEDLKSLVNEAIAGVDRAKDEVKVAKSAIESAKANLRSADADIKNSEADMDMAKVQMEDAERKMSRREALYKDGVIAREELDDAVTTYEAAVASYNALKAKVTSAYSRRDAAEAQLKTIESQSIATTASLKEAEANLSYNRAKLAHAIITSPISGTVVFKAFERGETVNPGVTILTVVDLQNLWVRVDVEETAIGKVVMNSEAFVTVEGVPGRVFKGKVTEIGRYGEFATQRDVIRGRQDIKTFRVKIAVVDPSGTLKPGMTVDVEILTEEGR